jgi:hypothetical protein
MWHFSYITDKQVWALRGSENVVFSVLNDIYILLEDAYHNPTLGWVFKEKNLNKQHVIDAIDSHEEEMKRKPDNKQKSVFDAPRRSARRLVHPIIHSIDEPFANIDEETQPELF